MHTLSGEIRIKLLLLEHKSLLLGRHIIQVLRFLQVHLQLCILDMQIYRYFSFLHRFGWQFSMHYTLCRCNLHCCPGGCSQPCVSVDTHVSEENSTAQKEFLLLNEALGKAGSSSVRNSMPVSAVVGNS